MSSWYEVKVEKVSYYLVEVEDGKGASDEAEDNALSCVSDWDYVTSSKIDLGQLEKYKRSTDSDKILPL